MYIRSMETKEMLKPLTSEALKAGKEFIFATKNEDDYREAGVLRRKFRNRDKYVIWFNGEMIHCGVTFPALRTRLVQLIRKWDLQLIETIWES